MYKIEANNINITGLFFNVDNKAIGLWVAIALFYNIL